MTSATSLDAPGNGFVDELQPGTLLMHGQYKIRDYLNSGGFGITYLATDSNSRTLVIKECFPSSFCRRSQLLVQARSHSYQDELRAIVRLFTREAEALERLSHPNIVGVHQVFEDNNTAYMALDFVEGRDLLSVIKTKEAVFEPDTIRALLKKLLDAIGYVHAAGLLHRDISPDNVIVTGAMEPVLIDFGAAREQATKATRALSALRVVKDGYSPQEFYIAGSEQSPSSDLYSLAATFYHLITGEIPPDSQIRLSAHVDGQNDPYVRLADRTDAFDPVFCAALDKAMSILPRDRVQSAQEWLDLMSGKAKITSKARHKSRLRKPDPAGGTQPKRSKVPVLLAATALVVVAGGGTFFYLDPLAGTPATQQDSVSVTAAAITHETTNPEPPQTTAISEPADGDRPAAGPGDRDQAQPPQPVQSSAPSPDTRQGLVGSGGLSGGWVVDFPFATRSGDDLTLTAVEPGQSGDLTPGLRIARIEGLPVATMGQAMNASRLSSPSSDGRWASVSLALEDPATGAFSEATLRVPMVYESVLPSGLTFHTRWADGAWVTTVAQVPEATTGTVRNGDVLIAVLPDKAPVENSDALRELLTRSLEAGEPSLRVAVRRDGSMWVETMTVGATAG